jgi:hypothetical protein
MMRNGGVSFIMINGVGVYVTYVNILFILSGKIQKSEIGQRCQI